MTLVGQSNGYLSEDEKAQLEDFAFEIRRLTIETVAYGQWGHIAGSVSMAEILAVLYSRVLRVDPHNPDWPARDRFVLSKAHTSPGLYSALALAGFFPVDELYTYCDLGGRLEGHSDMRATPGLDSSGGLLGLGLSVAQGMAIANRIMRRAGRVYCVLGDGELHEGNIWEAAMSAGHYRLSNLTAIVDYNKIMSKGRLDDFVTIEPLEAKWAAFNWYVRRVDGHDLDQLALTFDSVARDSQDRPTVVIADTIKGKGLVGFEDSHRWHTHAPDPATADSMLRGLARMYGRPEQGYSRIGAPVKKEHFVVG